MRNKYPGTCYRCGETVEAGAGHFEKIPGGWRTQHATCAIEHRNKKPTYDRPITQSEGSEGETFYRFNHTEQGV